MVVFLAWVTAFFGGVHVCFVCLCVTKSCINWKMSLYYSANMLNDVSSVKVSKNGWHKNFRVDHRLFPSPFPPPPSLKEDMGFCGTSYIMTSSCQGTRDALLTLLLWLCVLAAGRCSGRQGHHRQR